MVLLKYAQIFRNKNLDIEIKDILGNEKKNVYLKKS